MLEHLLDIEDRTAGFTVGLFDTYYMNFAILLLDGGGHWYTDDWSWKY